MSTDMSFYAPAPAPAQEYAFAPAPAPSEAEQTVINRITNITRVQNIYNNTAVAGEQQAAAPSATVSNMAWVVNQAYAENDMVLYVTKKGLGISRFRCLQDHISSDTITPENSEYWTLIDTPVIGLISSIVIQVILPLFLSIMLIMIFSKKPKFEKIVTLSKVMIFFSIIFILLNIFVKYTKDVFIYTSNTNAMIHGGVLIIFIILGWLAKNTSATIVNTM